MEQDQAPSSPPEKKRSSWLSKLKWVALALAGLYFILLIPETAPSVPPSGGKSPFIWDQDALWEAYEKQFLAAKAAGCEILVEDLVTSLDQVDQILDGMDSTYFPPDNPAFKRLEERFFNLGPMVGACEGRLKDYSNLYARMRGVLKKQSRQWDMTKPESRETLYRLVYGGRAAIEELMLQVEDSAQLEALSMGIPEPSETPMASILGVNIHSGDILLSRGGAAASALISRGNDFPGNFSHVALVHVDEKTNLPSIIEAHIEMGVAIADLEAYLADKKLRVEVLRPRRDLAPIVKDPQLAHKAAIYALKDAQGRHIPYDFSMDFEDPKALFCSEVAFNAYRREGLNLWMGISTISSPGLMNWLSAIGVRHFETHEPSDLEYDPQLTVVAEWRNLETLYQDHVDNAVIDVMLEGADKGDELSYNTYLLPIGRLLKGYSWVLNRFGKVGPVPEGMSAATALKVQDFADRHAAIKQRLLALADQFRKENGYRPPYWNLVRLAHEAIKE